MTALLLCACHYVYEGTMRELHPIRCLVVLGLEARGEQFIQRSPMISPK